MGKHVPLSVGLALLTLLLHTTTLRGADPPIVRNHPRIWIRPGDTALLKRRCRTTHAATWKFVKRRCDGELRSRDQIGWNGFRYLGMYAFAWQITGERKYAEKVVRHFAALAKHPPRNQYLTPEYVRMASLAYDWCHNAMTNAQRRKAAGVILKMCDYIGTIWRHNDYNNHFVNERMSVLWAGVALAGDGIADRKAAKLLAVGRTFLKKHVIVATNDVGTPFGGQAEGFSYSGWGYTPHVAQAVELWRTATGEDLFPTCPGLRGNAIWNIHCRIPWSHTQVRSEDCPSEKHWGGGTEKSYIRLLAARYHDGYAQWMADRIPNKYPQIAWLEILFRDPTLKAAPPDTLPLACHFPGLGHVAMRSRWSDRDATFAHFQCGPWWAGHQHADNNSFVIHKKGALAIDSGVNEYSSHRANYYARTVAHNSVLVYDPGEQFSSRTWGGKGSGGTNDGGQLRCPHPQRVGKMKKGGPFDGGSIVAFHTDEHVTYVCGDATRSYSPKKLNRFLRHFLYLRPNLFVVFDEAVATKPTFRKTWLLHTIEKPVLTDRRVRIRHKEGQLHVETLLPEAAKIKLIGGPGKEYFCDGRNWPPKKKRDPLAGAWRVEVSPTNPAAADTFLHVLLACDRLDAPPPTCRLLPESEGIGVEITTAKDRWTVRFTPAAVLISLTRDGRRILTSRALRRTVQKQALPWK